MYELRLLVTDEDAARLGAQNEAPDLSLPSPADRALQALADGLVIRELQSKGILLLRHPDGRYEEIVLRTVEKGLSRRGRLIRLAKQPVPERVRAQGEAEEYGVEDDGVEAEAQPGGSPSHRGGPMPP